MANYAIKIENLSKLYRLGLVGTGTLSHDLNRWWHRVRGKDDPYLKIGSTNIRETNADSEYIWALKDISLEIVHGEVVGIIGKNGAGKSTLLKILSRVTGPTKGQIKYKGRIGSLLEVGTGFHQEMTGRENIFLNGAILGMTKSEVKRKFDDIVDFSGCARYIDTPVKRFSSGMMVRLGFAVAAFLEPEILVVDEVLAVGDADFQQRAITKMKSVSSEEGRTVLFVSHNMNSIYNLCSRAILFKNGLVIADGKTENVVKRYLGFHDNQIFPAVIEKDTILDYFSGKNDLNSFLDLIKIEICDENSNFRSEFGSNEKIFVNIYFTIKYKPHDFRILITVIDENSKSIIVTQIKDSLNHLTSLAKDSYQVSCEFPANFFATNTYVCNLTLIDVKREHYQYDGIIKFKVKYDSKIYNYGSFDNAFIRPTFKWTLKGTINSL